MKSINLYYLSISFLTFATYSFTIGEVATSVIATIFLIAGIYFGSLLNEVLNIKKRKIHRLEENLIIANQTIAQQITLTHKNTSSLKSAYGVINMQDDILRVDNKIQAEQREAIKLLKDINAKLEEQKKLLKLQLSFELEAEHIIGQHLM